MPLKKHTTILMASKSFDYFSNAENPIQADAAHNVAETQVLLKNKWPHLWVQTQHEPLKIDPVTIQPGSDPQIILRTSGNLQLNITSGGTTRRYKSQPGDLFITPAHHEPYKLEWHSLAEQPIRTIHLYLSSELLAQTAVELTGADAARVQLWNGSCLMDPLLKQLTFSLGQELENPATGTCLFAETAAQLVAVQLLRQHCTMHYTISGHNGRLTRHQFRPLEEYIQSHLNQEITLTDLAAIACLSPYHFCRVFKKTSGQSPNQYVIEQRMKKAQQLLKLNLSAKQVADAIGYNSVSHFAHLFHRYFGCSPAYYRQVYS